MCASEHINTVGWWQWVGGSVPVALIIAPNPLSSVESKGNHYSSDNSLTFDIDELIREHPQIRQFVKTKPENDQQDLQLPYLK